MSSRIARLVFGLLPPRAAELGDAWVAEATLPPIKTALLGPLRQRLLSDEALAEYLQCGNADALTFLFERHSPHLYRIARRILRSGSTAKPALPGSPLPHH